MMILKAMFIFLALGLGYDLIYPAKRPCYKPDFTKEKDLRKIYLRLRYTAKTCLDHKVLLELTRRASLAGRLSEALWASKKGLEILNQNKNILVLLEFQLLQGSIFRKMNRLEEAIIVLRDVIRRKSPGGTSRQKKQIRLQQERAFLQLIYTYYNKTGSKESADVNYLINSFTSLHPDSRYLSLVHRWKEN